MLSADQPGNSLDNLTHKSDSIESVADIISNAADTNGSTSSNLETTA